MKKLLFGLIAIIMFGFAGNAQTVKDFLVKSQSSITTTSEDGYYSKFVKNVILPNGIHYDATQTFPLYTLNDENYKLIEIPLVSDAKIVNFMFVIIDLRQNTSKIIFKNHQKGSYEFFNQKLEKLYTLNFNDKNIVFSDGNQTVSKAKETCYQKCRREAYAEIESDWLSDLACSFNPCGAAIAIRCGIICG